MSWLFPSSLSRKMGMGSGLGVLCTSASTLACPLCDTATGEQVRAGILGASFAGNLLATLAPFPVLLLAVIALYFGLPATNADRQIEKKE